MSKLVTESCAVVHYVITALQDRTVESVDDALSCVAAITEELMNMREDLAA